MHDFEGLIWRTSEQRKCIHKSELGPMEKGRNRQYGCEAKGKTIVGSNCMYLWVVEAEHIIYIYYKALFSSVCEKYWHAIWSSPE